MTMIFAKIGFSLIKGKQNEISPKLVFLSQRVGKKNREMSEETKERKKRHWAEVNTETFDILTSQKKEKKRSTSGLVMRQTPIGTPVSNTQLCSAISASDVRVGDARAHTQTHTGEMHAGIFRLPDMVVTLQWRTL